MARTGFLILFTLFALMAERAFAADYSRCYTDDQRATCPSKSIAAAEASRVAWTYSSDSRDTACDVAYSAGDGGSEPDTATATIDRYQRTDTCPNGDIWAVRYFPKDEVSCTELSNITGAQSWTGGNGEACLGGCGYEPVIQAGGTTIDGKSYWVTDSSGLKPTGSVCGAPESVSESKAPGDCEPVPGQTLCVKQDGSLCATASNGKRLCWKPGETGTKTTGDTVGVKQAGSQHTVPNLNLASGDTLIEDQATKGVTSTTIKDGNSTTITSNVTTYKTTNGTDAGSSDQSDDSGEDDKGNSASGGGDCKTAPVVTGDAALGMVATQAWATRCAVEAGNATKVTGDIGDCKSAFSVEGDNAQAHQLRAMRAERCGDGPAWSKVTDMSQDPGKGQTSDDIAGVKSVEISTGDLDGSGFGGGQCIGFAAGSSSGVASGFLQELASPPPLWCNYIAVLKGVFVLVGAVAASYILTRSQ